MSSFQKSSNLHHEGWLVHTAVAATGAFRAFNGMSDRRDGYRGGVHDIITLAFKVLRLRMICVDRLWTESI